MRLAQFTSVIKPLLTMKMIDAFTNVRTIVNFIYLDGCLSMNL